MEIKRIENEKQYDRALERLDQIIDSEEHRDELYLLSLVIGEYEDREYPIEDVSPIEMIKFKMDQMGWKAKDFGSMIGSKSYASDILNGKKKLSLSIIRKVEKMMHIPASLLIQEY